MLHRNFTTTWISALKYCIYKTHVRFQTSKKTNIIIVSTVQPQLILTWVSWFLWYLYKTLGNALLVCVWKVRVCQQFYIVANANYTRIQNDYGYRPQKGPKNTVIQTWSYKHRMEFSIKFKNSSHFGSLEGTVDNS